MTDRFLQMDTLSRRLDQIVELSGARSAHEQLLRILGPQESQLNALAEELRRRDAWYQQLAAPAFAQQERTAQLLENFLGNTRGLTEALQAFLGANEPFRRLEQAAGELKIFTSVAAVTKSIEDSLTIFRSHDETVRFALSNPLLESASALVESTTILANAEDLLTRQAVEKAILLTDAQLRTTSDFLATLETPFDTIASPPPEPRRLVAPRLQRQELRRIRTSLSEASLEELTLWIPTGQGALLAQELVRLIAGVDEVVTITGRPLIFKRTNRLVRVFAELPFAAAVDRETFADFIDDLYFLLYEGAGADSLRYLIDNGGPLALSECSVVFVIKRLRNFFRHDPEHGDERKIQKKLEDLREDLSAWGFEGLPRDQAEYRRLQDLLLAETVALLRRLKGLLSS